MGKAMALCTRIWAVNTNRLCTYCAAYVSCIHTSIHIEHIRGCENIIADAVSRNILQVMHRETSGLDLVPVVILQALWQLLVTCRPDWLSAHWNQLWKEYFDESLASSTWRTYRSAQSDYWRFVDLCRHLLSQLPKIC